MIEVWEEMRLLWEQREPLTAGSYPHEAFYSGYYIGEKLMELGCPPDRIDAILMAAGQRQAGLDDEQIWQIAVHTIEEYKQGRWEMPGNELAEKIQRERFGENADPLNVIVEMAKHTPDKGGLFEKMMIARFMMTYGPPGPDQPPENEVVAHDQR